MSVDFLIPVYNCEPYIYQCIKSIRYCLSNQNIIIYNDGSTDKSLEIINAMAKKDKNITIINSHKNMGVVHSRFELIKNATSDYIFFLDSDDYLVNCSVISEYARKNQYDIVQFNRKKLNSANETATLDIQTSPFLVNKKIIFDLFGQWGKKNNITYSIHNKLIRRSLFGNFPYDESAYPEVYEDILINIYLLAQKPKVLLDNNYTYIYRKQIESLTSNPIRVIQSSQKLISYILNNFENTLNSKSLQLLQRNIFEYYILDKIKKECFTKEQAIECYRNLFSILSTNRHFFIDSTYNAIVSRIFSHAILLFDLKGITSVAINSQIDIDNAIYNTLKITSKYAKTFGMSSKKAMKKSFLEKCTSQVEKIKYSLYCYVYKHKKPYLAVIDYPGREEAQSYLKNRLPFPLKCFDSWDTKLSTMAAVENAKLIITSVPYAPLAKLKLRGEVFNCWHGSGAFKRFGKHDTHNQSIYGVTDYIICSSESIRDIYAESMRLPLNRVFATGTPRTDIYYDKEEIQKRTENFYLQYPQFERKKIYAYLPTYREFRKRRYFKLNFPVNELDTLLEDDEVFIVKNHPSISARISKNQGKSHRYTNVKSFGKVWNLDQLDTETLTMISNVFITDYSSSFFEAMILNKPLVFYAEDFNSYDRDFYFEYENLPGEKVLTSSPRELISAIRRSHSFMDKIIYNNFKDKYMKQCDGKATDRVVNIILDLMNK